MHLRPWQSLILILIVTFGAVWVALPGADFDFGNFRADHEIRQGLDLQGGLQVVLEADPPAGTKVDSATMNGTRDTVERRVNALGVSEPLIQTRGNNQIIVELPGLTDVNQAIDVLKTTALLEIVDPNGQFLPPGTIVNTTLGNATNEQMGIATPVPSTPEASPQASPSGSPSASPVASPIAGITTPEASATPTGPVYTTIISGRDLEDAFPTTNSLGQVVVGFRLSNSAAGTFFDYTSQHIGQPMSIVLDKKVISSPRIDAAISKEGIISGVSGAEVNDLVVQLQSGALSVPLKVVQSRVCWADTR